MYPLVFSHSYADQIFNYIVSLIPINVVYYAPNRDTHTRLSFPHSHVKSLSTPTRTNIITRFLVLPVFFSQIHLLVQAGTHFTPLIIVQHITNQLNHSLHTFNGVIYYNNVLLLPVTALLTHKLLQYLVGLYLFVLNILPQYSHVRSTSSIPGSTSPPAFAFITAKSTRICITIVHFILSATFFTDFFNFYSIIFT